MNIKPRAIALVGVLLSALPGWCRAEWPVIDGRFDDWADAAKINEAWADAPPKVDLGPVRWRRDAEGLWLNVQTRRAANLAFGGRTLAVLVDYGPGGLDYQGHAGVDLAIEFSPPHPERPRLGARVGRAKGGDWAYSDTLALGLLSAPTWASDRYEMLVGDLASDQPLKLSVVVWNDAAADSVNWFEVPGSANGPKRPPLPWGPPERGALRLLSWNLGGPDLLLRGPDLKRVLAVVAPDLLALDELPPEATADWLRDWLPPGQWRLHRGQGGGRQRQIIAARDPIAQVSPVAQLDPLPYTAEDAAVIEQRGNPTMKRDLRISPTVPAAGAALDWRGQSVVLVSADLQCCGTRGSLHDWLRERQIRSIVSALQAANALQGPTIVAGDFNLVGGAGPMAWLTATTGLRALSPLTPDGISNATWEKSDNPFPPGRLDFVLVSEHFRASRQLVLNPGRLIPGPHDALIAVADSVARLSDHLPLIVDLTLEAAEPGDSTDGDDSPAGGR